LLLFKKDFFADSKIKWKKINDKIFSNYLKKNLKISQNDSLQIYKNLGLEKNSNNFKIFCKKKIYLLKCVELKNSKKRSEIKNIIILLNWLKKNKSLVPNPISFKDGNYSINFRERNLFLSNYMRGNHFKGGKEEFNNVVKNICFTTKLLKKYRYKRNLKLHNISVSHLNKIIILMNKNKKRWINFFGKKKSKYLEKYWWKINNIILNLRSINYENKKLEVVHIDIHPHNIITRGNKFIGFLDSESWMLSSVQEAFAYGGFKLCRQVILNNRSQKVLSSIGNEYINLITKYYDKNLDFNKKILLLCEKVILERIVNIFKFNLLNNNKKWNKLLPVLLEHLDEARIIFNNYK
tara:strand:+ start:668 stop:1720 length:1053 start_codon:yes stop_codon:yes gene_type:complete